MTNDFKINWKNLLFPILSDIQEINKETDTNITAKNNSDLANNEIEYSKIIAAIRKSKSSTSKEDKSVEVHEK